MRTITKEFKIYRYEELNEKAKEKVRQKHFTYTIFFIYLYIIERR